MTNSTYNVFTRKDEIVPFVVGDIFGLSELLPTEVKNLKVIHLDVGTNDANANSVTMQSQLIRDLVSKVSDSFNMNETIIIMDACASLIEFPENKYTDDETKVTEEIKMVPFDAVIERQCKALASCNFVNINSYIGYEYCESHVYIGNKLGYAMAGIIKALEFKHNKTKGEN